MSKQIRQAIERGETFIPEVATLPAKWQTARKLTEQQRRDGSVWLVLHARTKKWMIAVWSYTYEEIVTFLDSTQEFPER